MSAQAVHGRDAHLEMLLARVRYLRHELAQALSAQVLAQTEEAKRAAERDEHQLRCMALMAEEAFIRARERRAEEDAGRRPDGARLLP